jgi:NAD(P)-dependent dehydrogenase (short-subunit alcohol dehydrogenase family)
MPPDLTPLAGNAAGIAAAVQYLTTRLSAYVTGQVIPVNGAGLLH